LFMINSSSYRSSTVYREQILAYSFIRIPAAEVALDLLRCRCCYCWQLAFVQQHTANLKRLTKCNSKSTSLNNNGRAAGTSPDFGSLEWLKTSIGCGWLQFSFGFGSFSVGFSVELARNADLTLQHPIKTQRKTDWFDFVKWLRSKK